MSPIQQTPQSARDPRRNPVHDPYFHVLHQAKARHWTYRPDTPPAYNFLTDRQPMAASHALSKVIQEERAMAQTQTPLQHVTADTLAAFSDAFNRHDTNALMTFMTEDCVFDAAGGPEVFGTRFVGREATRAAFEAVFKTFPDAHWGKGRHYVSGERGVSEWVFTGTHTEGWRIEAEGCDLFEFRDGLIAVKRAFRKERPKQNLAR